MTSEEKSVVDAAIELYHTAGQNRFFHIILGKLDAATSTLLASRVASKKPFVSENMDGTFMVMLGDEIIAGPIPDREEADEYIAAMKRGDC